VFFFLSLVEKCVKVNVFFYLMASLKQILLLFKKNSVSELETKHVYKDETTVLYLKTIKRHVTGITS